MNVLVIGSGGREHALAWKCAQSATVDKVFVAPGNAGTATEAKLENIAIDVMDFSALASFAQKEKIALSIVGPEAPLVEGIVDYFSERDPLLWTLGKRRPIGRIESLHQKFFK